MNERIEIKNLLPVTTEEEEEEELRIGIEKGFFEYESERKWDEKEKTMIGNMTLQFKIGDRLFVRSGHSHAFFLSAPVSPFFFPIINFIKQLISFNNTTILI